MDEKKTLETIRKFSSKLPKFSDGRIDYSNSDAAPVVTVFIKYNGRILLLKRSDKVRTYRGRWNTVAGYLDELKSVREKVLEEMREEVGVKENNILSIYYGEPYKFTDSKINKTWIVHPVLVELRGEPDLMLDWEHTEYKWIRPEEIKQFDIIPRLEKSLKRILDISAH